MFFPSAVGFYLITFFAPSPSAKCPMGAHGLKGYYCERVTLFPVLIPIGPQVTNSF